MTQTYEDADVVPMLAAVVANNSWEVGLAVLNPALVRLTLYQFADNRQFHQTTHLLQTRGVRDVAFVESHRDTVLLRVLCSNLSAVNCVPMARRAFNEEEGADRLRQLSVEAMNVQDSQQQYLARAAACALLRFAESAFRLAFRDNSLVVTFDALNTKMYIGASTAQALELVVNNRTGKSTGSLFSVVDHTKTKMGARVLRGELLSPPCDLVLIRSRQDAVEELLENVRARENIETLLPKFHDLDQIVLERCRQSVVLDTMPKLKRVIDGMIKLREVLALAPLLCAALEGLESPLWRSLYQNMEEKLSGLVNLRAMVDMILAPDVYHEKNAAKMQIQQVFCVRNDKNGMLDVARLAYVQCLKEMEQLVEQYAHDTGVRYALTFSPARGYYLSVPRAQEAQLQDDFIKARVQRSKILGTTNELATLNAQQHYHTECIFRLTVDQLSELEDSCSDNLDVLLLMSHTVASMDLFTSMALYATASGSGPMVRPTLRSGDDADSLLAIQAGRHPVLDVLMDGACVPNDFALSGKVPFALVTGPNCSGKTTLLKQCATMVILAHVGLWVPAKAAQVPLTGAVLSLLGSEDSIETNASSFSREMTELAHTLNVLEHNRIRDTTTHTSTSATASTQSPQAAQTGENEAGRTEPEAETRDNTASTNTGATTLVVLDELGCATNEMDALALAVGTVEYLMSQPRTLALFSTHLHTLVDTIRTDSHAKLLEFGTARLDDPDDDDESNEQLHLLRNSNSGSVANAKDGNVFGKSNAMSLAARCGMPTSVVEEAMAMRAVVTGATSRLRSPAPSGDVSVDA